MWSSLNYNVRLVLVQSFGDGVAFGVWGYQVLAMLLYKVTDGSNTRVGLAEGVQGAVEAAVAVPAGWIADRANTIMKCQRNNGR